MADGLIIALMAVLVAWIGSELAGRRGAPGAGGALERRRRRSLLERLADGLPALIYFLLGVAASLFAPELRAAIGF